MHRTRKLKKKKNQKRLEGIHLGNSCIHSTHSMKHLSCAVGSTVTELALWPPQDGLPQGYPEPASGQNPPSFAKKKKKKRPIGWFSRQEVWRLPWNI